MMPRSADPAPYDCGGGNYDRQDSEHGSVLAKIILGEQKSKIYNRRTTKRDQMPWHSVASVLGAFFHMLMILKDCHHTVRCERLKDADCQS